MITSLQNLLRIISLCDLNEKGQGGATWIAVSALITVVLVIMFCCLLGTE